MIGLYEHFKLALDVAFNDLYWWIFGNHNGWLESLSYLANIVMALAAIVAGIYAFFQLKHSKKNANLSFVMDLIDRIHEIHVAMDEAEKEEKEKESGNANIKDHYVKKNRVAEQLFNLLEAYCGFLKDESVSGEAYKALDALLSEELPALKEIEPFKKMLEDSNAHPTRFENIKWFLAGCPRSRRFLVF